LQKRAGQFAPAELLVSHQLSGLYRRFFIITQQQLEALERGGIKRVFHFHLRISQGISMHFKGTISPDIELNLRFWNIK
jgi:hypothetical protein